MRSGVSFVDLSESVQAGHDPTFVRESAASVERMSASPASLDRMPMRVTDGTSDARARAAAGLLVAIERRRAAGSARAVLGRGAAEPAPPATPVADRPRTGATPLRGPARDADAAGAAVLALALRAARLPGADPTDPRAGTGGLDWWEGRGRLG